MKLIPLTCALLALAGCATAPAEVKIQYVDRPVRVDCLGKDPVQPSYRTEKLRGTPITTEAASAVFVKGLGSDLVQTKQYVVELKAQMAGCR